MALTIHFGKATLGRKGDTFNGGYSIDSQRIIQHCLALFFLIIGLWGLFRAIRGQAVNGNYLGRRSSAN